MTSLSLLEIAVLHINCLCHRVFLKCCWNALTIRYNFLKSWVLNKYFPQEGSSRHTCLQCLPFLHKYSHTSPVLFISIQLHFKILGCWCSILYSPIKILKLNNQPWQDGTPSVIMASRNVLRIDVRSYASLVTALIRFPAVVPIVSCVQGQHHPSVCYIHSLNFSQLCFTFRNKH